MQLYGFLSRLLIYRVERSHQLVIEAIAHQLVIEAIARALVSIEKRSLLLVIDAIAPQNPNQTPQFSPDKMIFDASGEAEAIWLKGR